jgi:hypothetical protein
MSDLGNPVRLKFLPSLAFTIAHQRSTTVRVLQKHTSRLASQTTRNACEVVVYPCLQAEAFHTPVTPATPATSDALISLHDLITAWPCAWQDEQTVPIEHVQKLANTAHISFAERALLRDRTRLLSRMNNEAKVRRSIKLVVLGKARAISYNNIEKARAKRAAKEVQESRARGRCSGSKSASARMI